MSTYKRNYMGVSKYIYLLYGTWLLGRPQPLDNDRGKQGGAGTIYPEHPSSFHTFFCPARDMGHQLPNPHCTSTGRDPLTSQVRVSTCLWVLKTSAWPILHNTVCAELCSTVQW